MDSLRSVRPGIITGGLLDNAVRRFRWRVKMLAMRMSSVNKEEHLRLLQSDFLSRSNVMCLRGDKRELSRNDGGRESKNESHNREGGRERDVIRQSSLISVC